MAVAKTSLGVSALKGFCEAMRSAGCRLGSLAYGSSTCLLVLPPSCSGSQNSVWPWQKAGRAGTISRALGQETGCHINSGWKQRHRLMPAAKHIM